MTLNVFKSRFYTSVLWNRSPQKQVSEHPTVIPAKAGIQKFLIFPGFRVALAIASLPGMTIKLFNGFQEHETCESWFIACLGLCRFVFFL
jgi:hypothetical protein